MLRGRVGVGNFGKVGVGHFTSDSATLFFSVIDRNVFDMTKKIVISVRMSDKYRLINTATASLNTTVRQMTAMFQ